MNKIEISGFFWNFPEQYGSANVIIRRDKRQSYRAHKRDARRRKNRRTK